MNRNLLSKYLVVSVLISSAGCSSPPKMGEPSDPKRSESEEMRQLLTDLGTRIQVLETKISSLNDKLDDKHDSSKSASSSTLKETGIIPPAHSNAGQPIDGATLDANSETGFVNNGFIQGFRKALLLFQGQQYSEAVLAFSELLDKFPDHPLAGSAQFYIGESYLKQKEYKLAIQEFQRVLSSYDKSPHIADTLAEMALAEDAIKNTLDAKKHRQLLTSLFPQSPANQPAPGVDEAQPMLGSHPSGLNPPAQTEGPALGMSASPQAETQATQKGHLPQVEDQPTHEGHLPQTEDQSSLTSHTSRAETHPSSLSPPPQIEAQLDRPPVAPQIAPATIDLMPETTPPLTAPMMNPGMNSGDTTSETTPHHP